MKKHKYKIVQYDKNNNITYYQIDKRWYKYKYDNYNRLIHYENHKGVVKNFFYNKDNKLITTSITKLKKRRINEDMLETCFAIVLVILAYIFFIWLCMLGIQSITYA